MHPLDVLETVLQRSGIEGVKRPLHREAVGLANRAELAAIRHAWWRSHNTDLLVQLGGGVDDLAAVGQGLVNNLTTSSGEVHHVPPIAGWEAGQPFMLFQERLKDSLVRAGFCSSSAHALVAAFSEMASNALEHAASPIAPVCTFEVRANWWAFSVTDVGVGVLGSLQQNPTYASIPDDVTALETAMRDGVSSTGEAGRGYGFTRLFRSLADRSCKIRLRTVGALASWDGKSPGAQHLSLTPMPPRIGFHVAVGGSFPQKAA